MAQFKGLFEILGVYWKAYGGLRAVLSSPYFIFSILFSTGCYPLWLCDRNTAWFDICLSVIPNLLGFTLGGYAILLAFGDDQFRAILTGEEEDGTPSPFVEINATFVHFILLQTMSLIFAIASLSWNIKTGPLAFIGLSIFVYSIATALAAAFGIFRLARWFDKYQSSKNSENT